MKRTRFTKKTDKEIPIDWRPISLSIPIVNELIKHSSGQNLIILYKFYLDACNYQKTNQAWVTDKFCMKGLGWGSSRFHNSKKGLIDIGLIITIRPHKMGGKFSKPYVKVLTTLKHTNNGVATHNTDFSVTSVNGATQRDKAENTTTNSRKRGGNPPFNKHNTDLTQHVPAVHKCFIYNKENKCDLFWKTFLECFPNEWQQIKEFKSTIVKYAKYRYKQKPKLSLDDKLMKFIANELISYGSPEAAIVSMNRSIEKKWKGVHPPPKHSDKRQRTKKEFIIDDGIKYVLGDDGRYRHSVTGDVYIP